MKSFAISLYFGASRLWCFIHASDLASAEAFAADWSAGYTPAPDCFLVLEL